MLNCTLRYIILYVSDFDQAYTFYKDVLQLSVKMQQGTYVEFDTGQTTFAINTRDSVREEIGLTVPQEQEKTATFEVAFTVEDVAQTIDVLRSKGVQIIKEPVTKPWGQTVAYIADPDGHYIEICSEIGA